MAVRFREEEADMEEMTIWEQYTVTLNKDSKVGFGLAISGGRDKPNPDTGDMAVVISDVVRNGPAAGRLHTRDQIVMVNGVSMENVSSNFTIQHLKGCGKTANITVKRPRKIQIPLTNRPNRSASHSNLLDGPSANRGQRRGSDSGSEPGYGLRGRRARSHTPEPNGHPLALMSGFKRLPKQEGSDKPIKATLLKKKPNDEYGLKLGSQIFIKHMTDTGLAAKEGTLQEGDLVLKINGMTTENLSLLETKHLVEKSKGKLTMLVLRDQRQFLVNIPEVDDSPNNSDDDDRRDDSSSELEDISDLDIPSTRGRVSRSEARERRMRRSRAEAAPKIRDSPPVRSTVNRPPAQAMPTRRLPSDSESDRSTSPRPRRDTTDPKYRTLSGIPVPNPHTAPVSYSLNPAVWAPPHAASSSSRPRKEVSESDSDQSASPPPRRSSPRMDDPKRYRVLPDITHPGISLRPTPVSISSMRSSPKDDSESDSSSSPPRRQGTPTSPDSRNRYRATPVGSPLTPPADQPRWIAPAMRDSPVPKRSDSEASYTSVPEQNAPQTRNAWQGKDGYRVFPETQSPLMPLRQDPVRRSPSPDRPPQEDSSGSERVPSPPQRYESTEYDISPSFPVNGTLRTNMSEPRSPTGYSKNEEEPLYSLPPDSPDIPSFSTDGYSSDLRKVEFVKENSVGLRLVGGNDVGIFVAGVQPHSPAHQQGMKEGDQMLQVNGVDFSRMTREEAAMFLLNLRKGEPVEIFTQNKMDIYKKILKSSLGDSFYIRTHFDHEPEGPTGLGFTRGEVFRVVDTMHRGKLGNWLAIRMGNDLHELDKGTIPNQARAETIANLERTQRASSSERQGSGPRAEFWKLRGLRGAKKNVRKSRDDLLQLTIQGKYPAYEKVLLREAGFKRPIVIMGPLNDVAMEKLASEMPEEFQLADMVPRSGGEGSSSVIKLETVRQIAEQNKHPLVDITPTAVERLSYIQYHPLVLFLDPHSRKDVKIMRQRLCPNSNKSSRRLFAQARKTRKYYSHLFAERIELQPNSDVWYEVLKDKIHQQQAKPVWVSEVMLEGGEREELDTLTRTNSSDYLSCDSRATSDYEDTDGEAYTDGDGYTDGEAYTDNEDLADHYPRHDSRRNMGVARSSEPTRGQDSPTQDFEPISEAPPRQLPPILHVPKPKPLDHAPSSPVQASDSSPQSDVPPDFRAPNPPSQESFPELPTSEDLPETHEPASLSAIEEKLKQTRMAEPQEKKPSPPFVVLAHREAVQWRRTQIQGSDTSDDNDEIDDIEWGPATEL
ncbi:tight junction protein ZO-3 isoform X1 [Brienomyrus brachyistius]|uniref:tight junction protein ZO-3 isoform X1 n=2 Tax=Brienomyrus brachyistius TaxID=42636 RepID=UPI0020B1B5CD|nr:tight junction protein ZO-3 isoform X1 [Brienomyrus brachyistius]XP_048860365.1 tight junction protein ZO-3 isoform X1 [Brienomyrus brachyistius]